MQGSGFQLKGVGIITCAHVVSEKGKVFDALEAFKYSNPTVKYKLNVERICPHRDVAICSITSDDGTTIPSDCVEKTDDAIEMQENVKLLGFPAYAPGHSHYMVDSKVAKIYTQSAVSKFEIDKLIREGNSGGPIINLNSEVVGVALEGARKEAGNNGCLVITEIEEVLTNDAYKI